MNSRDLLYALRECGINLATGVPDSLQQDFCTLIASRQSPIEHFPATSEGSAIGLAVGLHLATGSAPLVYMQNSGLGNAFNPLISLAHSTIYRIPMILMIGWRGKPGFRDEPQHQAQGAVTTDMLDLLDIPFLVITNETSLVDIKKFICSESTRDVGPVAILVSPDTFDQTINVLDTDNRSLMSREGAVASLLRNSSERCVFVSTTGKLSREVAEIRSAQQTARYDFMTVGGMGHAASIALGIAIGRTDKTVICLDGDGAALMHLGAMAMAGEQGPTNFVHILFNNGVHESVGGQPIASRLSTFTDIARSLKYKTTRSIYTYEGLDAFISEIDQIMKPCLIELHVNTFSRVNLTRPKDAPMENKQNFMRYLSKKES